MRAKTFRVAALLLVSAGSALLAQNPPPPGARGRGPGGPPPMMRCMGTADSLTDAQKAQVKSLGDAFMKAYAAQFDSLRAVAEAARAAREAGKSPDEVRAIMEQSKAINDHLAPARQEFHDAVTKLLTPSQVANGCIPPAPGGPMGGGMRGRRGGPPGTPPGPPPV